MATITHDLNRPFSCFLNTYDDGIQVNHTHEAYTSEQIKQMNKKQLIEIIKNLSADIEMLRNNLNNVATNNVECELTDKHIRTIAKAYLFKKI